MPIDTALLAEVPLFQFLDDTERETLAAQLDDVHFDTGQRLFAVDEPGRGMFVIRRGEVELFYTDNTGRKILLDVVGAGDFVGEISMLDGGGHTASAEAVADTDVLRVDRHDLEVLFKLHPAAAFDLLQSLGRRMRTTAELLRHTASRNVVEELEDRRTPLQRAADWIAAFSGSMPFLFIHLALFAIWIGWNVWPGAAAFDPFPFGLLTMVVSLEAIILSVFVLLSQNRQAERDRVRSDADYDVNLKAELEIMQLHEKLDRLTADVLGRLESLDQRLMG